MDWSIDKGGAIIPAWMIPESQLAGHSSSIIQGDGRNT